MESTDDSVSRSTHWYRTTLGRRTDALRKLREKASQRGIEWSLSQEEYAASLGEGVCHYCSGRIDTGGVGLDRKNNELGYEAGNVVPCCFSCNAEKGATITYDEYLWLWKFRTNRAEAEGAVARRALPSHASVGGCHGVIADRAEKREMGLDPSAPWPALPADGETVFQWRTALRITQDQAAALLTKLGESGWSRNMLQRKEHVPFESYERKRALAVEAHRERAARDTRPRRALICSVCGALGHNKRTCSSACR